MCVTRNDQHPNPRFVLFGRTAEFQEARGQMATSPIGFTFGVTSVALHRVQQHMEGQLIFYESEQPTWFWSPTRGIRDYTPVSALMNRLYTETSRRPFLSEALALWDRSHDRLDFRSRQNKLFGKWCVSWNDYFSLFPVSDCKDLIKNSQLKTKMTCFDWRGLAVRLGFGFKNDCKETDETTPLWRHCWISTAY